MIFLSVPLVMIEWMLGGQVNKIIRPIAIPLTVLAVYALAHNHPWWCALPALMYGGELTLGYGDNSKLKKWLKDDELVRIAYGLLCQIPPCVCAILTGNTWAPWISFLIFTAFQVRAGSLGKIGKYDILIVDIYRGLSVGISMSCALI